ncbi:MAG: cell division topological specificity factor MinE [Vulcanimicrobiota bacterium]
MNSLLLKVPIFHRLFGPKEDSRNAARERLKTALVGDRQTVAPQLMNCLQKEIEECTSRYLRADKEHSVYKIVDKDGKMTLKVEIPILHINRQRDLPQEALKEEKSEESVELRLHGTKLRKRRVKKKSNPESEE